MQWSESRINAQRDMLANRLKKNVRRLRRYLKAGSVSCYRVYDCDIPEVPVVVDVYGDALHVSVVEKKANPTGDVAGLWVEALCIGAADALGIDLDDVYLKRRERQRGQTQYERLGGSGQRREVVEDGLKFLVNLSDYHDTGLFLDHRQTRAMVRADASGRRMLNLFAYTGSFSVYAAAGGAASTTTVDLSGPYSEWARDNMALNGFSGPEHQGVQSETLRFLEEDDGVYDLAVVDPPTFSNSKRFDGVFDLQRDHEKLLNAVAERMNPGGIVYFSTNFRRFELAPCWAERLIDITASTLPPDYRNTRIHRCFRGEMP
ncbi:MAG: 23S rRNA G2069 N7-methylase RlmK/C1962 C5-methylase RlmI [Myxococcota bacterium]